MKWKELPYTSATWENLDKSCGLKGADDAVQDYLKLRKRMDPKKQDKKERKRGRKDKSRAGKEVRATTHTYMYFILHICIGVC